MSLIYKFMFLFICGIPQSRADDNEGQFLVFPGGSMSNNRTFDLNNATGILDFIDPTKRICSYIPGFNYALDGVALTTIIKTLLDNNYTVIIVIYPAKAYAPCPLSYSLAIDKSLEIGSKVGKALVSLRNLAISSINITLIIIPAGHSLGAHIMAKVGESAQLAGFTFPLMIGLDPVRIGFDDSIVRPGLNPSCAKTVVVVYTDPSQGGLGTQKVRGCVNLYPNCGEDKQPGCPSKTNILDYLLDCDALRDNCNHGRALLLIFEAISNNCTLVGSKANNCATWHQEGGDPNDLACLELNDNYKGDCGAYFFRTAPNSLYGLGIAGSQPTQAK